MARALVILGSAREGSNTLKAVQELCPFQNYELIDLRKHTIHPYRYDSENIPPDDFLMIVDNMLQADVIVFATPVYWYAMSGIMKAFFDRFSQLLREYKTRGRALKGKEVYLIATSSEPTLSEGFEVPFRRTAEYLDMNYKGAFFKYFP